MKVARFVLFIASLVFVSGCGLVPDKVTAKISGLLAPPAGYVPFDRIDVFNNISGTYMILSDRGGVKPEHITTGNFGWVPQSTYFGNDGIDHLYDDTITARFYDANTGEYFGLWHWQTSGYIGYQAIHSPYERKQLEH